MRTAPEFTQTDPLLPR